MCQTHARAGIARDNIRKRNNIRLSASSKFRRKVAIASRRPDPLRFHLSGIFVKQVDVSRQYEPDRTLFPWNAVLAHRPETYYAPVRRNSE